MQCPRCGRTLDLKRGKAMHFAEVNEILTALYEEGPALASFLTSALGTTADITYCMNTHCGYSAAGKTVADTFRNAPDLIDEAALLEALLTYREHHEDQSQPRHEPGS